VAVFGGISDENIVKIDRDQATFTYDYESYTLGRKQNLKSGSSTIYVSVGFSDISGLFGTQM
jgi:hypothetical protein